MRRISFLSTGFVSLLLLSTTHLAAQEPEAQTEAPADDVTIEPSWFDSGCQGCDLWGDFCAGCDSADCNSCYDGAVCEIDDGCSSHRVTFQIDALLMRRIDSSNDILLTDTATAAVLLASDTFDSGYEPGVELDIEYRMTDCDTFEFRYFWLNDWTDTRTGVSGAGGINLLTNPITTRATTQTFTAVYESELQNVEFNFMRRSYGDLRMLVGLRFTEVNERLGMNLFDGSGPPIVEDLVWETENLLYGIQIGADRSFYCFSDCFTIDGFARGGLFLNDTRVDLRRVQTQGGAIQPNPVFGFDNEDDFALLAEFGLESRYQIRRNWAFLFGYRAMWVDGVAIATEQVSSTSSGGGIGLLGGQVAVNANMGTLFYHGFNFGLEGRW